MNSEAGHFPDRCYIDQDGQLHLNGSVIHTDELGTTISGTELAASDAGLLVGGVAAGYKIARGETALDGGNPTPVVTGLTTVIAFVATLKGSVAPGLGTSTLTAVVAAGTVNVYAWKPTGAGDTTLIASAGVESFYWAAVGV